MKIDLRMCKTGDVLMFRDGSVCSFESYNESEYTLITQQPRKGMTNRDTLSDFWFHHPDGTMVFGPSTGNFVICVNPSEDYVKNYQESVLLFRRSEANLKLAKELTNVLKNNPGILFMNALVKIGFDFNSPSDEPWLILERFTSTQSYECP